MNATGFLAIEQTGETLVITPRRDLGGFVRTEFQDEVFDVLNRIDDADIRGVVLDLGSIDYFGSIMLEFVVRVRSKLRQKEGKLAVCQVSPAGQEVFYAARFDSHFIETRTLNRAIEMVSE